MKWGIRFAAGLMFILLYIKVWRPIRSVVARRIVLEELQHVTTHHSKTIKLIDKKQATGFYYKKITAGPHDFTPYRYKAPAGDFFLLPGFFIIILFFQWKPLMGLFTFHIIAGFVATVIYTLGVAYSTILLSTGDFLIYTIIPAVSLAWIPMIYIFRKDNCRTAGGAESLHGERGGEVRSEK